MVVLTPNYPAQVEFFQPPDTSGRTETSSNTIDSVSFHFTDEYGNNVMSLENFVITLVFDEVLTSPLPEQDRVSLFKIRKQTAEDVRQELSKKLRLSNNELIR